MGDKEIPILYYASDALLMSDSEDSPQRLLNQFDLTSEKFNIIATEKTK